MKLKILKLFWIVLMIAVVITYIGDILINHTAPTHHLFKAIIVMVPAVAGFVRSSNFGPSLATYEALYLDEIKNAFSRSPAERKTLLKAIRCYEKGNLTKAQAYLTALQPKCQIPDEHRAVRMFLAAIYTDTNREREAYDLYMELIAMDLMNSVLYANLGSLCGRFEDRDEAHEYLEKAIELDPCNPQAHQNMASLYFATIQFAPAVEHAKKALELDPTLAAAAALLAVIYGIEADAAQSQHYAVIAAANGEDRAAIERAIAQYKARKPL